MISLRMIPLILASLLLGAHFLRDGAVALVLLCVLLPFLLLIRRRWVLHLLQGYSLIAALVWAQTTYALAQSRMAEGETWLRMLLILGGVTLFTLWAGYLIRSPRVRARYVPRTEQSEQEPGAVAGGRAE